jgi:hypothetical protein
MLNSGVGVSLLLKFKPVLAASNTSKADCWLFLELHPVIEMNKQNIQTRET